MATRRPKQDRPAPPPYAVDSFADSRALQAYRYHSFGKTWDEAAQLAQFPSADAARKAAKRLVAEQNARGVEEIRAMLGTRLEQMFSIIAPEIEAGNLWAFDRALAITEQYRKLFGADTPLTQAAPTPPVVVEVQVGVWSGI